MAIGDIRIIDGVEYETVWSGGEGLSADRETKTTGFWTAPPRIYNKKSDYWTKPRGKRETKIDPFGEGEVDFNIEAQGEVEGEVQEASEVSGEEEAKDSL